jgi:hypothetical protein
MANPGLTAKLQESGLGLGATPADELVAVVGAATSGTVNEVNEFVDAPGVRAKYGAGPLVELAAFLLASGVRSVVGVRATSTAGATSPVVPARVGTSTGTVAVSNDPSDAYDVRVRITRAGAIGVAAFQLSLDGGDTYLAETLVPASGIFDPAGAGFRLTFANGAGPAFFDVGDVFAFASNAPTVSTANIGLALDALKVSTKATSVVVLEGIPAPALSTVTSLGTAPPTVTLSGTPAGYYDLRIEITTGGALATAVFRWSKDGGATWTTSVVTGASVALGTTGITATFGAGTYALDNVYTAHSAQGIAVIAAYLNGKMEEWFTAGRDALAVMSAPSGPDLKDGALERATLNLTALRVSVCADTAEVVLQNGQSQRRSSSWLAAQRIGLRPVHEHLGRVATGGLTGCTSLYRDEFRTPLLDGARYTTLRTMTEASGFFITRGRLLSSPTSDFKRVEHLRVINRAMRFTRARAALTVAESFQVNADGTLDAATADALDKALTRAAANAVLPASASDVRVVVDRTHDVLSDDRILFTLGVRPLGYAEFVTLTGGFARLPQEV